MQNDPRLFGIDLSRPWMQASIAARELMAACWRGLSPSPRVTILRENQTPAATKSSRYRAIELPDHILLRRSLLLPPTTAEQLRAAVALDIQAHSPFEPEQALWTCQVRMQDQRQTVDWALTTRPLVEAHLHERQFTSKDVEVWIPFGDKHQTLSGFGEAPRLRHIRRRAWFNGFLVLTALTLATAIAVTPTVKIRLQALQAQAAQHQLTVQAAPVLQQRERLMQRHAQAAQIQQTINNGIAALPAMAALTQALPDDTVLRTLRLQGTHAHMSGQTANAADLMKQLGKQTGITDVRAPSAATRPPGSSKEQFELEMQLRPALEVAQPEVTAPETGKPISPPPTTSPAEPKPSQT